jgi:hypothetical protein
MTHPIDTPTDTPTDTQNAPIDHAASTGAQPESDATVGAPATVISGRVGTRDDADRLQQGLIRAGFAHGDIEIFYTGPAGRHDVTPFGGDSYPAAAWNATGPTGTSSCCSTDALPRTR